jgi:chromosome segregation ATPase
LQATQAESDQKIKDLDAQVKVLLKQSTADKASSDKSIESLKVRLAQASEEAARLKEALAQSQAAHEKAVTADRAAEEKIAKLLADVGVFQRTVAELQSRNHELFKIANEILTRYEKFSLGDALAAKEPFVGTTRTRLENQVQDYQDKLRDQRTSP